MKAVVLHAEQVEHKGITVNLKPSISIENRDNRVLKKNELLVAPKSVGICGSDFGACRSNKDGNIQFSGPLDPPVVLGHELCGVVSQVGREVNGITPGQWVVSETIFSCGFCPSCKASMHNHCENNRLLGLTIDGAMAEEVILPSKHCWVVDDAFANCESSNRLSDVLTFVEPVACVTNGLMKTRRKLWQGARVAVIGLGPIGLSAAIIFQKLTGRPTVAVDRSSERCLLAENEGIAITINSDISEMTAQSVISEVSKLLPDGKIDLIVEAAGIPGNCIPKFIEKLDSYGELLYMARAGQLLSIQADIIVSNAILLLGTRGPNGIAMQHAIELISRNINRFEKLITQRVGFDEISKWLTERDYLSEGKIIFYPATKK